MMHINTVAADSIVFFNVAPIVDMSSTIFRVLVSNVCLLRDLLLVSYSRREMVLFFSLMEIRTDYDREQEEICVHFIDSLCVKRNRICTI